MVWLSIANALFVVAGYGLTVALGHVLTPADFGFYGVAAALVTVVNMAATRGVPLAAATVLAREAGALAPTMRATRAAAAGVALVLAGGGAVAALAVPELLDAEELRGPLAIAGLSCVTFTVLAVRLTPALAARAFAVQAASQATYGVVRAALVVGGALAAGLAGAVGGLVLAPLAAALPTAWHRPRPRAAIATGAAPRARQLVRAGWPIGSMAVLVTLLLVADFAAFQLVGTPTDAGVYFAAATLAHVPYFLLQSGPLAVVPTIAAQADEAGRRAALRQLLDVSVAILALPVLGLLIVGGAALPLIFGQAYDHGTIVAPLTLATVAITVFTTLAAVQAALGSGQRVLVRGCVGVAVLASVVGVAGGDSDLAGAAWGTAAAIGALALVEIALVVRRFGWRLLSRDAPTAVVLAAVCAAPLALADARLGTLLAAAAVSAAVYGVGALRLGLLTRALSHPGDETVAGVDASVP